MVETTNTATISLQAPSADRGWICPKCDRAVKPSLETCPKCEPTAALPWPSVPYWPQPVQPYLPTPMLPAWPYGTWCSANG